MKNDRLWAAMEYVEQLGDVETDVLLNMLVDAFLAGSVYGATSHREVLTEIFSQPNAL